MLIGVQPSSVQVFDRLPNEQRDRGNFEHYSYKMPYNSLLWQLHCVSINILLILKKIMHRNIARQNFHYIYSHLIAACHTEMYVSLWNTPKY